MKEGILNHYQNAFFDNCFMQYYNESINDEKDMNRSHAIQREEWLV